MKILTYLILFSMLPLFLNAQWYPQTSGTNENLTSVCFTDTLNGWVVGYNGIHLHTNNGGLNWNSPPGSSIDETLTGVYFTDSTHGWIAGYTSPGWIDEGFIYRTVDGGNNWERIDLGFFVPHEIYFTDSLNGWTCSGPLHTSDGGLSWEYQFDEFCDIGGVCFTDSLNGWVVCSTFNGSTGYTRSIILHTNNGGNSWDYQYNVNSLTAPSLCDVHFTDSLNGWAAGGGYEIILKTIDGGNNWDTSFMNNTGVLFSVYFIDSFNGWAVGLDGSIISTADGGNTWEQEPSGTTHNLLSVSFTEKGYGWAVGLEGTILHADYSQIVGMNEFEFQNSITSVRSYPNPFSNSITIEYELKQKRSVQITIYNHLGEQLELIQQIQPAGKQQLFWNADRYPSGIYFCVIKTGEGKQTTKMIKL